MNNLERDRAARSESDPRLRLKRLWVRFERLTREEAAWSLAEPVEALLAAAEKMIPLSEGSAELADALDKIFIAVGDLLDGLE